MGFLERAASLPIRCTSTCVMPSPASRPCLGVLGDGGCEWLSWFSCKLVLRSRSKCSRDDSRGDTGAAKLCWSSHPCLPGKEADDRNSGNDVALSNGETSVPGEVDTSADVDKRGCRVSAASNGDMHAPDAP